MPVLVGFGLQIAMKIRGESTNHSCKMTISYSKVKSAMIVPPPRELVDLFNYLGERLSNHPECVQDSNPFDKLSEANSFCISATSIQVDYIAFVLGKNVKANFPPEIMHLFFNLNSDYRVQYGAVDGEDIDGCLFIVHSGPGEYDLKEVYENIYH